MKRGRNEEGEVDMASCLMLLSKVGENCTNPSKERGDFKCKTCNRQFLSFQALGGHRASHKRLKLMDTDLSSHQLPAGSTVKPKIHLCPICGLEFTNGQALGGHMRKHRAALPIHDHAGLISNGPKRFPFCLDLNLTPYENGLNLNLRTPVLNQSFS